MKCHSREVLIGIIVPDWDKAILVRKGDISSIEVPLAGDIFVKGILNECHGKKIIADVASRLIIQKNHETGDLRYFVSTIIGKPSMNRGIMNSGNELRFFNQGGFSGLKIISDVDGRYLDAYLYENGSRERVMLAEASEYGGIDSSSVVMSFSLMNQESSGLYLRSGESGGGTEPPRYCALCQRLNCSGDCQVVIRYCRTCHNPVDECVCCPDCHDSPCSCNQPPTPWKCPDCFSYYCDGNCQTTPGGGGGGTPGESHADGEMEIEWWKSGHDEIIDDVLKGQLNEEQLLLLKNGSAWADTKDNQKAGKAHMHAMTEPGESKGKTIERMREHFKEYVNLFRDGGTYWHLGVALHMIMDVYSPAHSLSVWKNNILYYIPHAFEGTYMNYGNVDYAKNATAWVYSNIMNSDYETEEIFNTWINGYLGPLYPDAQK